jgi:hypothetical protein
VIDLGRRAVFERYAEEARAQPPEVGWACAAAALNMTVLTAVVSSFALGRGLGMALALAREADPTPLVDAGFEHEVERALGIVDRVAEVAGSPRPSPDEVAAIARLRNTDPPQQGGPGALPWGERSRGIGHPVHAAPRDRYLQAPLDRLIRQIRPRIAEPAVADVVDEWLTSLDDNYAALAAGAETDHGEVAVDASMLEASGASAGLHSPARARTDDHEIAIATNLLRVAGGISPQPDGIWAQAGEVWRIRGHLLADGSVMPCRGTFRLRQ